VAELQYPQIIQRFGPWLIDAEQLVEFDNLVGREFSRLETVLKESLDEAVRTECDDFITKKTGQREQLGRQYPEEEIERDRTQRENLVRPRLARRYKTERSVEVYLKKEKVLSGKTFSEIAIHPEVLTDVGIGFDATFKVGGSNITLSLSPIGSMELLCVHDLSTEAAPLYGALRSWMHRVEPPRWQRAWFELASTPIIWAIFLLLVMIGVLAALTPGSPYKGEAHGLLAAGITTPDKQRKALELLLAISSNYRRTISIPNWFIVSVVAGFAVCVVLSICPNVSIGIGKGAKSVETWRRWSTFAFVSVPTFFLTSIISRLFDKFL
jgi:hypothetical protein